MVQIVGNLEWELLKMWKLVNLYTPVSQTLDSWTPFSRISPISRKITYVLFCSIKLCLYDMKYDFVKSLKTAPYTRKYHFSDTAQNPH